MSQLDLMGGEHPLDTQPALTDRQQLAIAYVQENQPVAADELGAVLHADRRDRGGRGHDPDARCDWCADEGKQMLRALRSKGLARQQRGSGWYATHLSSSEESNTQGAAFGDFPQGF